MVKARILRKLIPPAQVSWDGGSVLDMEAPAGGWIEIDSPGSQFKVIYYQDYFDLSGYVDQQETCFPQSIVLQQIQPLKGTGTFLYRLDLATKTPISEDDINNFLTLGTPNQLAPPGSIESRFTLEEVFLGRLQLWEQSQDVGTYGLSAENAWGLGDATAGSKIYLATAYFIDVFNFNVFNIPEGAYVIPALVDKEDDLEYIMRLKRTYELQG